ncbi:hypothetical protein AN478_04750 [Thiohalorhabdus denitrificans]|uniref:Uncharacterized protein n=1 Tax=Thiohalorhabdus denitrificans TaxID=381306 RepID=A0A0P9EFL4_9GAMM|nr:DUF1264 domain-containing protein [Thiohalorhabdus denitrificans]KPV41202.1 hypothetical protein AN478_04750 [Thiohalorhabdus denitrificans]SCY63363.1 Protein of unknown function [Thiohalorhabdus denitrificans]
MLNWISALRITPFGVATGLSLAAAYLLLRPGRSHNPTRPWGDRKTPLTRLLETGATATQLRPPLRGFHTYLVGFHPMKENPERQWIAHHWCRLANDEFAECVMFDGKTWHLWDTGTDRQPGDDLPFGEPKLAWSFNHAGELQPWLQALRDRELGINTEARRASREDLVDHAHPQSGADALQGRFERPTRDIPGVQERRARIESKGH